MPPVKISFHTFFQTGIDDLATRSDDLLGSIGFPLVTKTLFRKKRSSNAFSVPKVIIGAHVASLEYFTTIFPISLL